MTEVAVAVVGETDDGSKAVLLFFFLCVCVSGLYSTLYSALASAALLIRYGQWPPAVGRRTKGQNRMSDVTPLRAPTRHPYNGGAPHLAINHARSASAHQSKRPPIIRVA